MVRHAVTAWAAHPKYDWQGGCPNVTPDVGLVKLATPLDGVTPIAMATAANGGGVPAAGTVCTAVGYGQHTTGGNDTFEQKRVGTVSVVDGTASSIQVAMGTAIPDSGDSGGPLLCNGQLFGATTCHSDGDFPDHTREFYSRLDASSDWIAMQIAAWQ
jgi:hypothetical protein